MTSEGRVLTPLDARAAQVHYDAVQDTNDAYTQFHGWVLTCSWCQYEALGRTKMEALSRMQEHYDGFAQYGYRIKVSAGKGGLND